MKQLTNHGGDGAIEFRVNGHDESVAADPLTPLADVLRDDLMLTGTKLGCRGGDCGSCTVLVDRVPVASCLMPAGQAEGRDVVTIEGVAGEPRYTRLFEAFRRNNASQCGFCIPGFLVAATAIVDEGDEPSVAEVHEQLAGNLCRCTGYESIAQAVVEATETQQEAS